MKFEKIVFSNNYIKKEVRFTIRGNSDSFFILYIKNIVIFNSGCHSPPLFNQKIKLNGGRNGK